MKKSYLFIAYLLTILLSCNNEDILLKTSASENEQYDFYVVEALDVMNMPRPKGSYNYPCLPGMTSWENLTSDKEIEQVCRVPENVLKEQSTQAVIQALWEHPQFKSLIRYSSNTSIQQSLDKVFSTWDIYKELIKRTDAASCLVERYQKMKLTKESHTFYNNSLQLLLSQKVFLDQLSIDVKKQLAKDIVKKIDVVKNILSVNIGQKSPSVDSSYFCLVRIMTCSEYAPILALANKDDSMKKFEKSGDVLFLSSDFRKIIIDLSMNFIDCK